MLTVTWDTAFNVTNSSEIVGSSSFVFAVVKHLGLCIMLTDYLTWALRINDIVQVVVSLLGIVGGALSLVVTSLQKKRSSLSVQVALMSLYDVIFLTLVLIHAILKLADVTDDAVIAVFQVLRQLSLWCVTYTLVDISIERCLSIATPFLARKLFGVGFTLKKAGAVFGAGVAFTVPFVVDLIFGFSTENECDVDRSLSVYGVVYTLYTVHILLYLLPFAVILVANAMLVRALMQVGKHNGATNANSSAAAQSDASAKQLSIFVVGVSVWYGACMLAPSILFLVRLARLELFEPNTDIVVAIAADTLVVLSAAANFLFYFLLWRHFRHTFLTMFCRKCRSTDLKHEHASSPYSGTTSSSEPVSAGNKTASTAVSGE